MDIFEWILLMFVLIGAGLVISSLVGFRAAAKQAEAAGLKGIDDKLEEFGDTIAEADNAINELNDLSKDVFSRFDEKYKELLYLYNLIDEKKKDEKKKDEKNAAADGGRKGVDVRIDDERAALLAPIGKLSRKAYKNERFSRVLAMRDQGMEAADIAKQLKIGKGEVSLILELNRRA